MNRGIVLVLLVVVILLAVAPIASAWAPQDIYDDYATHGKLTRDYTEAELRAYLNDATLHQYGKRPVLDQLDSLADKELGRSSFPFTGFQLMMGVFVAAVLVGAGFLLRRLARHV